MFETLHVSVPAPGYGLGSFPLAGLCLRGNIVKPGSFDILKFDWWTRRFASISQVVAVAQLCVWANNLHAEANLGDVPVTIDPYVSRMNLYRIAGIAHHEDFTRHPGEDRFLPIERVVEHQDAGHVASKMTDVLMSRLGVDTSVVDLVNLSFGEIMDNIIQHSGSASGGLAAAQYYPNVAGRYVEICVSDCGRGIVESMSRNPSYEGLAPSELMATAFKDGYGERVGPQFLGDEGVGMGRGLAIAERLVNNLGGVMWAVSQGQSARLSNGITTTSEEYWFPGTIIVVRVPMVRGAVINAADVVLRDIPGRFAWSVDEGAGMVNAEGDTDALLW